MLVQQGRISYCMWTISPHWALSCTSMPDTQACIVKLGEYLLKYLQTRDSIVASLPNKLNTSPNMQYSFQIEWGNPFNYSTPASATTNKCSVAQLLYMYMQQKTCTCWAERRICCIRLSHRAAALVLLASPDSLASARQGRRDGFRQILAGRWVLGH